METLIRKNDLSDIILSGDELLLIQGGASQIEGITCGDGCGLGCGSGCGAGCSGCSKEIEEPTNLTWT